MKTIFIFLLQVFVFSITAQNKIIGKWKTIDDETNQEKSIIEIFIKENKLYGKVIKILTPGQENKLCTKCEGENKNKPILGMFIINGLTYNNDNQEWKGIILDPNNGKKYNCYLKLLSDNLLKVRGYIGLSVIGRTQYWYRVE